MNIPYEIRWTGGLIERDFGTYAKAIEWVLLDYEDAVIGHSGDLQDGGDRTLCWRTEDDAANDDGQRAVCSIHRMQVDAVTRDIS